MGLFDWLFGTPTVLTIRCAWSVRDCTLRSRSGLSRWSPPDGHQGVILSLQFSAKPGALLLPSDLDLRSSDSGPHDSSAMCLALTQPEDRGYYPEDPHLRWLLPAPSEVTIPDSSCFGYMLFAPLKENFGGVTLMLKGSEMSSRKLEEQESPFR